MTSDLFHQSHHFLIGKADFFKLEAVILFSSFLQQQSGVFIGVWVLPTRTNEQTGRQAGTLISPPCTDSGCACCSLKSHIRRTWCFRFFQSREHFYFHFFQADPCFPRENVRCKLKRIFWRYPPNSQKNVRCQVGGIFQIFWKVPDKQKKTVRCKLRGIALWREKFYSCRTR